MLTSRDIRVLHLEPTDVCQASCPQCARETDADFRKDQRHHLTLEQIQQHCTDAMIEQLDKMYMYGNYGDPAAGLHTLEIYRYFRRINPSIVLGMNTNGALQNTTWWKNLGKLFHSQKDYAVFSIDGLADTNHIYRRGVDWTKLMKNIEAYIATGASAHWDMLVYQHNQHQVDACERLANDMGFNWFRAKVSKRAFINGLQFPIGWLDPVISHGLIQCQAEKEKSLYIDAQGRASACCWLGATQTNFVADDLRSVRLTWHTDHPHPICQKTCSTIQSQNSFTNQWQHEVNFV